MPASLPLSLEQLRKLSVPELQSLAEDIRQIIISTCLKNGGHIGASLGAVEITLALHSIFHSPEESIVWDVGHQAYTHKILTDRWERFGTLRQLNGISGFLRREESAHDVFGAGHSSTALSAALGIAWAKKQNAQGHSENLPWTIAVVGDGGLTAGLSFEALNNAKSADFGPLLIVVNDNQMSISENVGAVPSILADQDAGLFFKLFGCDYVGPIDGHDLSTLKEEIYRIKEQYSGKPVVLHTLTIKGKGYSPAEEQPAIYHGIGPIRSSSNKSPVTPAKTYSDVFGEALCQLAASDPKIVALTAAMPEGTGLIPFSKQFPHRFFDVGIAEGHAVTFAAGLATQGFKPVVAIYSTFLQRALDEIIHDVALQKLGVVFAIDRAGLVGADGPTHHGVFDLAYLGMIPEMTITAPSCLDDLPKLLGEAVSAQKPWVIRYPRGSGTQTLAIRSENQIRFHQEASKPRIITVALGNAAQKVAAAVQKVDSKNEWITSISTVYAKPIPSQLISYLTLRSKENSKIKIITVEDGSKRGGVGQEILRLLHLDSNLYQGDIEILGYEDHFIGHGTPAELEEQEHLSQNELVKKLIECSHV